MGVRVYPSEARRLEELADERLGFAAGDGDEAAFEVLFRRHQPAVLAFCRHMLGRADEAQDAAQQTFLTAYRVLRAGEPIKAVRPWLYTVARNRCITMLRARREHPATEAVEPVVDGLAAEVLQRADVRALLRDVAELPEDQREALLLAELADLSHGEIADVIGVRRQKVKALVYQARATLLAAKDARDTPCHDVREELATARGAALRRAPLRRHLHACPGCREFRDQLRGQRRALRALLPVVPPLRDVSFGAAAELSASAGAGVALKAVAVKVAIAVTLAGGAGGTALVSDRDGGGSSAGVTPANSGSEGVGAPASRRGVDGVAKTELPRPVTMVKARRPGTTMNAVRPGTKAKTRGPGTKPEDRGAGANARGPTTKANDRGPTTKANDRGPGSKAKARGPGTKPEDRGLGAKAKARRPAQAKVRGPTAKAKDRQPGTKREDLQPATRRAARHPATRTDARRPATKAKDRQPGTKREDRQPATSSRRPAPETDSGGRTGGPVTNSRDSAAARGQATRPQRPAASRTQAGGSEPDGTGTVAWANEPANAGVTDSPDARRQAPADQATAKAP
jgi:RNA polymerase sigma factor (sigma-70 family)